MTHTSNCACAECVRNRQRRAPEYERPMFSGLRISSFTETARTFVASAKRLQRGLRLRAWEAHEQQANPRAGHDPGDEDGER